MPLLEFLTPKWLEAYESIVREAAGEDLSGIEFSMCEIMKNVPAHLRRGADADADAHIGFRISQGRIEFPDRPWDDATFKLIADFESIAPWLDMPAEQTRAAGVMERLHRAGKMRFFGALVDAPKFVGTLHDRLGEITAPHVGSPYWEA